MVSTGSRLILLVAAICLGVPGGECGTCEDDEPCIHGTCSDVNSGGFSCACDPGWEGAECNKGGFGAYAECTDDTDCSGNGNCVSFGTKMFCDCVEGLAGEHCDIECGPVDLGFVMDGSGSVRQANWNRMIRLLNALVDTLPVGPSDANFGALKFATNATVYFNLNEGTSKSAVTTGLDDIPYTGGYTDIPAGMDIAKSLFTIANGDRADANNVVLLVAGGRATKFLGEWTTSESPAIFRGKADELKERAHVIAFGLQNARDDQMSWTASDPDEYTVKVQYTEIGDYLPIIKSLICKASARCADGNPCANLVNRRCTDGPTGPTCPCELGFEGPDCLQDINECEPNPCLNGGCCDDLIDDYECTCAAGFTGCNCETVIPCHHHADSSESASGGSSSESISRSEENNSELGDQETEDEIPADLVQGWKTQQKKKHFQWGKIGSVWNANRPTWLGRK